MSGSADNRILGLSPRARRVVVPAFAIAAVVIALGLVLDRQGASSDTAGPVVGGDLHAVAQLGSRLYVGGHAGAGVRSDAGPWKQLSSLDDKDVMAWAASGPRQLAGGHEGLFAAKNGTTFSKVAGLQVSDVHAVGATGDVVYLASPEAGLLVSTDGGNTFKSRGATGRDFMGTIWVNPHAPDTAIAPSMNQGAVKTTDGGVTWTPLGSASGTMSVAVDRNGADLVAIGMGGAQVSRDGGATWRPLKVPEGTSAASYTSDGTLIAAVLDHDRAQVFEEHGGDWKLLA